MTAGVHARMFVFGSRVFHPGFPAAESLYFKASFLSAQGVPTSRGAFMPDLRFTKSPKNN
jgi:hypothetical protein